MSTEKFGRALEVAGELSVEKLDGDTPRGWALSVGASLFLILGLGLAYEIYSNSDDVEHYTETVKDLKDTIVPAPR